ncbi:AI-2E family transporter [Sphingomonas quercus]|uniref:AI-2E family transporter n=1 Tax=Sphingomonas quercus TaxID=2842451 RepID=A0ABS6BGU5_9SPHN|nr:AI-2E family transporter [Sphingomonas quercus]MBU3077518.1 AI-2E family transporter [Sphingomonas quercus]
MDSSTPAQLRARVALAVAVALGALWIGAAFVPAVLWAGVVAIAVEPLRLRLMALWPGRRTLVAALITCAVLLVVIVPLIIAVSRAVLEAQGAILWLSDARSHGVPVPRWVAALPFGSAQVTDWWNAHLLTAAAASEQFGRVDADMLLSQSRTVTHSIIRRVVVFAFTVVVLFFVLRDRDAIVDQLGRGARRAFGPAGERVGQQIFASVRGTVDGLVLLGLAQGIIMAVIYAAGGVPHPILMGLISGVASMVPFGLIAILLIALLLLVVQGAMMAAIIVGGLGIAINFVADHFVRPGLIGGTTRLPFVWVLIGIVGGVETIGLLGLFVGPAVMATLMLLWREWVASGDIGTSEG